LGGDSCVGFTAHTLAGLFEAVLAGSTGVGRACGRKWIMPVSGGTGVAVACWLGRRTSGAVGPAGLAGVVAASAGLQKPDLVVQVCPLLSVQVVIPFALLHVPLFILAVPPGGFGGVNVSMILVPEAVPGAGGWHIFPVGGIGGGGWQTLPGGLGIGI
jgi:hypothetical protein